MSENLRQLSDRGVAIWLDDLSRDRIITGGLLKLVKESHVVGVTTNPTIFQLAITKSSTYDQQLRFLARHGATVDEAVRAITTDDVRAACDVLSPVASTQGGGDGRVSIEVDPRLANDTAATVAQARELWESVGRPNLYIKIPATKAGLPAIQQVISEGISVNVTLIFSIERYREVMEAYIAGLEARVASGGSVQGIESVASFFVSRVDLEIDNRLTSLGTDEALALRGQAAIANARLAYLAYEETFTGPRWEALLAQHAAPQRPLWASTGVKNPDYDDTMYVTQLIAPGVVNTMPEGTLVAVADHGVIGEHTIRDNYDDAQDVVAALHALGVELGEITQLLEDQGVEKFEVAWNDLLASIEAQLEAGA